MTMIAGYKLKVGAFLQADILLTSPDMWMNSSPIPSFHAKDAEPRLNDRVVMGLCQKILLVNERFAVAFAGNVNDIQAVGRLIDQLIKVDPQLSGKRFIEAFLADKLLRKAEVSIIALSIEGDEISISNVDAEFGGGNDHFELWVGGSGGKYIVEYFEKFSPDNFDVPEGDVVALGTCMALRQFALHLISEFEGRFESETIKMLCGGGYEVLAYYGGQFQKISDVVYAFADAEIDAEGILQIDFPKFLMKSTYDEDELMIRSVEIKYDEDEDEHLACNDQTFIIAPITRYHELAVRSNCNAIKFVGEFLCFLIKVKLQGESFIIPIVRKYRSKIFFLGEAFAATVGHYGVQIIYMDDFRELVTAQVFEHMRELKLQSGLT